MDFDSNRYSIIKAINSPLGFFSLSLLTVEVFLGIVLIYSDLDRSAKFWGMMIGALMFIIVVSLVAYFVYSMPKNLTFGEEGHLKDKEVFGSEGKEISKTELEKQKKIEPVNPSSTH